ncbi:hypothetical protein ABIE44_001036 [Marmoricola sp. OAE513]|uniref:hypothetical protein n=1 Tax=Marmoricola sp. OAE513 TaxID=2817894 RepID=UPI001AE0FC9C
MAVLAAMLVLAGQSRSDDEVTPTTVPTTTPLLSPPAAPGARPVRNPSSILVMNVTGGIGGTDELVVVRPSGIYLVDNGRDPVARGVLTSRDLADLVRAVREADLGRDDGIHQDPCCDRVIYTFTYGGAAYRTVQGMVPQRLEKLRLLVLGIAARSGNGLVVGS